MTPVSPLVTLSDFQCVCVSECFRVSVEIGFNPERPNGPNVYNPECPKPQMSTTANLEPRMSVRGMQGQESRHQQVEFCDNRKYTGENCKSRLRDTFKQTICPLCLTVWGKTFWGLSQFGWIPHLSWLLPSCKQKFFKNRKKALNMFSVSVFWKT